MHNLLIEIWYTTSNHLECKITPSIPEVYFLTRILLSRDRLQPYHEILLPYTYEAYLWVVESPAFVLALVEQGESVVLVEKVEGIMPLDWFS